MILPISGSFCKIQRKCNILRADGFKHKRESADEPFCLLSIVDMYIVDVYISPINTHIYIFVYPQKDLNVVINKRQEAFCVIAEFCEIDY